MKRVAILLTLLALISCRGQTPPLSTPAPAASLRTSPTPEMDTPPAFSIIGYFPDYREWNPAWTKYLTDVIYFSAEPRADGTLDTSRFDKNVLTELHEAQGINGIRILLSIGGWERSSQFAAMTANVRTRRSFVENLAAYIHENKFNGADFDWEFPENKTEFENYIRLLKEVKTDFEPKGLLVSVSLSPDLGFPLKEFSIADRIHIMSYDRAQRHSTYEQSVEDLQTFLDVGIAPDKLILGIPFYGRVTFPPYTAFSYSEIVEKYHPSPETDELDDIYFNGADTVQRKICYAMSQRIGGVMVWELSQDSTEEASLLKAMFDVYTGETACK